MTVTPAPGASLLVKIPTLLESAQSMAKEQVNNPLHGMTLEKILVSLQEFYGWEGLGERISIRCFTHDPSVKSSLKFLRKTPWARKKVEALFLYTLETYGEKEGSE